MAALRHFFIAVLGICCWMSNLPSLLGNDQLDFMENKYKIGISKSKISEICSFVANTCFKCVQLKACFWCEQPFFASASGRRGGQCLANIDHMPRNRCLRKSSYIKSSCGTNRQLTAKHEQDRDVLQRLLLLLRRLRRKKPNEKENILSTKSNLYSTNKVLDKQVIKGNFISETKNHTTENSVNKLVVAAVVDFHKDLNKSSITINVKNRKYNSSVSIPQNNSLKSMESGLREETFHCNRRNKTVCNKDFTCIWRRVLGCVSITTTVPKKLNTNYIVTRSNLDLDVPSCQTRRTCESCVPHGKCYWCDSTKSCHFYPEHSYIPEGCRRHWYHRSCSNRITGLIILIPTIFIIVFIAVGYVCVKNCYYHQQKPVELKLEERPILFKQKNGRTVYQITESEEEDDWKDTDEKSIPTCQMINNNRQIIW